jgi:hypothetical protein
LTPHVRAVDGTLGLSLLPGNAEWCRVRGVDNCGEMPRLIAYADRTSGKGGYPEAVAGLMRAAFAVLGA